MFIHTPLGCYEIVRWCIPIKAMDHEMGWEPFEEIAHNLDIFAEFEHRNFAAFVHLFHGCIFDDVKVMDFHGVDGRRGHDFGGGHHVGVVFSRESEYDVDAYVQIPSLTSVDGIGIGRKVVPSVHPVEGAIMDAL